MFSVLPSRYLAQGLGRRRLNVCQSSGYTLCSCYSVPVGWRHSHCVSQGGGPDKRGLWPLTHLSPNSGIPTVSETLPLLIRS